MIFDFVPYPGAPPGDADLYMKENVFLTVLRQRCAGRQASVLYATQRPLAASASGQPSGPPAWKNIRSW